MASAGGGLGPGLSTPEDIVASAQGMGFALTMGAVYFGQHYSRSNRVRAEIVEGGVKVWLSEESRPHVQRRAAARVRSTASCGCRFHRRSQDDCS
jgi:hypothetical protein